MLGLRGVLVATLVFGGSITTWMVTSASAQQAAPQANPPKYDRLEMADALKNPAAVKEKRRIVTEMVKGASAFNRQEFDDYYKGFLIPALTMVENPVYVNAARGLIIEDIDRANDKVAADMNPVILERMKVIAEGNYHPSATIIATQMIGRLNQSRGRSTIVPYPQALKVLFDLFNNAKNEGVRAAALAGLERHAELAGDGWDDNYRTALVDRAFLPFLKAPRPPHRSERSDAWLRGRVLEVSTKFKHSKEAEFYQIAADALADPKSNPILMDKALLVMGKYPTALKAEVGKPAVTNSLRVLVTRLNTWKKEMGERGYVPSGGGSDVDGGMAAEEMNMAEDLGGEEGGMPKKKKAPRPKPTIKQTPDVIAKRRALHEALETTRFGYTGTPFGTVPSEIKKGIAPALPEGEAMAAMNELLTKVKTLQDALNTPTITDRNNLGSEVMPKLDDLVTFADEFIRFIEVPADGPGPAPPATEPATPAPAAADVTAVR